MTLFSSVEGKRYACKVRFDEDGNFTDGLDDVHLDYLVDGVGSYSAGTGLTTVTAPVSLLTPTVLGLTSDGTVEDLSSKVTSKTTPTDDGQPTSAVMSFDVPGQFTRLVVGQAFEALLKFSKPYPKRYGPRGEMVADLRHRFQLTSLDLNITQSGPFEVLVGRPYRDVRTETFTGLSLGDVPSLVGGSTVGSGSFRVGLKGRTEELTVTLVSRNWMPLCLTSALWRGTQIRKV